MVVVGSHVWSAGEDGYVRVWNTMGDMVTEWKPFVTHQHVVRAMALVQQGEHLFVWCASPTYGDIHEYDSNPQAMQSSMKKYTLGIGKALLGRQVRCEHGYSRKQASKQARSLTHSWCRCSSSVKNFLSLIVPIGGEPVTCICRVDNHVWLGTKKALLIVNFRGEQVGRIEMQAGITVLYYSHPFVWCGFDNGELQIWRMKSSVRAMPSAHTHTHAACGEMRGD